MNKTKNELSPKIIFSCLMASCLEIYDFAIFGYFAPVMHKNYLSFVDLQTATIITYLFFAIGFVFRPLGSIIFGYIGDVYGRKKSLVTSVSLMGIASFLMFILPTYEMIGVTACYVIVLVRIIQGVSVGGEFSGAIIFAVEHSTKKNAGLVAAIVSAGGASGVLLSSLVSNILQDPKLPEYSWRFAFLIGFGLSILGYFIRQRITDSPIFQKPRAKTIPLFSGIKKFKTEMIASVLLSAANGVTFYFGAVYLGKMLSEVRTDYAWNFAPIIVGITMSLSLPVFGAVSDRLKRRNVLFVATPLMALYSVSLLSCIAEIDGINSVVLLLVLYTLIVASITASVNAHVVEIFPPEYRMSCSSLSYSLGMGLIGGTVPMVASYISESFGNQPIFLGYYISSVCILAFFATWAVHLKQSSARKGGVFFSDNIEIVNEIN